ncbi:hypothetical protein GIB67_023906 [Kingdonia uniflora]|uniref:Uncharacterized protein n=1 Tax=Kingdonia uniflora TaxID=39325 RepID=A0A7J7NG84_9MAGN|nr:hypothetical protein GIB67_023906 [Kingdonia uniflora]
MAALRGKNLALRQIHILTLKAERKKFGVESHLIYRVVVDMETLPIMEASTSSRSAEFESVVYDREDKVEFIQFPDFPGKLGDCLYRDDEEPMELMCRTVKQSPSSKVKKKSLLDIVAQEGVKLEAMLKELGISRKMRANGRSKKV